MHMLHRNAVAYHSFQYSKNLLAIIQSIAHQSFHGTRSPEEMRAAFEGRLGALAAAHDILTRQRWESVLIRQLIEAAVGAVVPNDGRVRLDGPDLLLPPKTGVSLAMAIHELATNALKYGAFSVPDGRLRVTWAPFEKRGRAWLAID